MPPLLHSPLWQLFLSLWQVSPSVVEGLMVVIYRHLQRPRPLQRRYPRVLYVEVVVTKCAECFIVSLEETLPHPLQHTSVALCVHINDSFHKFVLSCCNFIPDLARGEEADRISVLVGAAIINSGPR